MVSHTSTITPSTVEVQLHNLPSRPASAKQGVSERVLEPPRHEDVADLVLDEARGTEAGTEVVQRWNESWTVLSRVLATFWSFMVMGANDSAYGPLIPYLEEYYDVSHTIVSLIFLSPFVGYILSAFLNNILHLRFGQRGVAFVCASSHLLAYTVIALHPPFGVLVVAFILAGFGNGTANAAWNAWVGGLANSSEVLGILHSCYGIGGVISPLFATALITKAEVPWYYFYYIMLGLAALELATSASAFWRANAAAYRRSYRDSGIEKEVGLKEAVFRMPTARTSWTLAVFVLAYSGVEVGLGGWIVLFMIDVRHGAAFASGMSATGFWLGIAVGRAVLGFVTPRLGVKVASSVYIVAAMALELVFWLVPEFYVSVVAVALQGFFLGPLFPNIVLVTGQLLPRHQHVVVIGFAAAIGGCGAAALPFLTGILAQSFGVQVLQPIILTLLVALLIIWLCLPRVSKKRD